MKVDYTLRQLEYFVSVLDAGSLTEGAKKSSISQAAASMAITQLERAMGVDLLLRTRSKGVVPTAAGQALGARARRLLAEVSEIPETIRNGVEDLRGRVSVGCMIPLSPRIVPKLIVEVAGRWPEIEIDFSEGAAEELQQAAAEGTLDVAFVYSLQAVPGVDLLPIAESHPHLMLSENHPLAHREFLHFADLADQDAVLLDVPPSAERALEMFHSAGVEPHVRWKSVVSETIRQLVASGLAYSLTNIWEGSKDLYSSSGIALVPIADDVPANGLVAAVAPATRRPRRVDAVIEAARSSVSDSLPEHH
ncbi:MAG TPA: LysR family transcriptional regulator [Tepidisphaeraceae bacterium]|nr:LysR family transcriptional regulator [Tepidisphaeraceae bacterium]